MADRIHSIDTIRTIAIFFVVLAHVSPFRGYGTYGNHIFFILDTIGQFDVQFFFVASGYFLAKKLDPHIVEFRLQSTIQKIGSLYLFGILLYLPVLVARAGGSALLQGDSVRSVILSRLFDSLSVTGLLYYGNSIAYHLWFLTALLFAICFISLLVYFEKPHYILPLAATAHIIGLIGQNYPMLFEVPFPTRDAVFFGFFYVALGFQIRRIDWTPNKNRSRVYLGAFLALLLIQLIEQYAIGYIFQNHALINEVYTTEYTVTTLFLVLALFAYALSNPDFGKGTFLPKLGKYAVGIYLVHLPVYHAFMEVNRLLMNVVGIDMAGTLSWQLVMTPVVYVLALVIYLLAAKVGIIEIGGSHIPRLSRIRAQMGSSKSNTNPVSD